MKLTVVLGVLVGTLVLACSSAAPAPVEPTANIGATVDAALARVPTVTPIPTPTPPTTLTSTSTTTPAPTSVFITIYEAVAEFGFQVGVQKIADSYSYPFYEVMEDMRQGFPVEFRESIQQLVTGAGFPQGHVTCDMYGNSLDSFSREKLEQVSFSFGFEDTPTAISITPDEVRATPCYTVVPAATSVPTPTAIPIFAPKAMLTPISALTHTHLPVQIVGRAKVDTTQRFRMQVISEYILVKISHDRSDYQSIGYVVDRISKDGYVMESFRRSIGNSVNQRIAPGTAVYEEKLFVYSVSEYSKFGPFEYQIRGISSEWWSGNSWAVVEPAAKDDHGDSFISATVTEPPDFDWMVKTSMLQIFGDLETPDDTDYFSFEAYGVKEFFVFSPRFLPLATDTGGGIPKIALYSAGRSTPFASIGVEENLFYTPECPGTIYLAVSNSNPGYTGKYRVIVDRAHTREHPPTPTLKPKPSGGPTPTPIPTLTPTSPRCSPTTSQFAPRTSSSTATPSSDFFELEEANNGDLYITNKTGDSKKYKVMCKSKYNLLLTDEYRHELDYLNNWSFGYYLERGTTALKELETTELTDGYDDSIFINSWNNLMAGDPPGNLRIRTALWQELVAHVERVKGIDPESIRYPNATDITSKTAETVLSRGPIDVNQRVSIDMTLCGTGSLIEWRITHFETERERMEREEELRREEDQERRQMERDRMEREEERQRDREDRDAEMRQDEVPYSMDEVPYT